MCLKTAIVLILFLQCICVISERGDFERVYRCKQETDNLKSVIERIVEEIAIRSNCIAFITDSFYRSILDLHHIKILSFLSMYNIALRDNEDFSMPRKVIEETLHYAKANGCDAYVILIANGLLTSRFLQYAEGDRLIDTRGLFLLLYDSRLFRPGLNYIWNRIVNAVFIQQYNTYKYRSGQSMAMERIDLNTVDYPSYDRDFTAIKYIDAWYNGKFRYGNDHFVPKTKDLRGNALRVAIFEHIPAVTEASRDYYQQSVEEPSVKALGIEFEVCFVYQPDGKNVAKLLRIISKAMNFKAIYYMPSDIAIERWGKEGENNSYTGLLGEAVLGNADFFLGDLHYTVHHLNYLDLSTPYNTECLTFLTPEALTDNSWKLLILAFRPNVWIAILFSVLLGGGASYLFALFYKKYVGSHMDLEDEKMKDNNVMAGLYLFTNFPNSVLYSYSMLLQVSLPRLPNADGVRMFIGWWWLYSILVAVLYRASMTAALANPIARVSIDSVEQLSKTSIEVGGWSEESRKFFLTSSDPYSQDIGNKFELIENEESAVDRVANGTFCYYENSFLLRHVRGERISENDEQRNKSDTDTDSTVKYDLHIMEECVVYMPIALGLEKNSPLKPHVDLWVRRMIEIGLVQKWLSDVMEWSKIKEAQQKSESEQKALINLRKLHGAFVVLAIGCFLGSIALLGEILHWKYVVLKDPAYDKYHLDIFYRKKEA